MMKEKNKTMKIYIEKCNREGIVLMQIPLPHCVKIQVFVFIGK